MRSGNRRAMQMLFPIFRAFYQRRHKIDAGTVEKGHEQISAVLDRLRSEIQPSGYLVGDRFSIADLTAAALLSPLADPTELEYAPPEPLPPSFERLRQEFAGDPMFHWVREIYRRHRGHSAEVKA
jgi:glutathione S-transferase